MIGLKEGEIAIITTINLDDPSKRKLMSLGIIEGAQISINYSPQITGLYSINILGKKISLRKSVAHNIEVKKLD